MTSSSSRPRTGRRRVSDVLRTKPPAAEGPLALRSMPALRGERRVRVVVPVRVAAKAHLRNELRRRVAGAARPMAARLKDGVAVVISVRSSEVPRGHVLELLVVSLAEKSGIIRR